MRIDGPGPVFFVGIWLAAFTGAFEATGLGPSFPLVARELSGSADVSPYITSFTAVSFASAVGLGGFLRRANYTKWFLAATLIQVLGLVVCAFSTSQFSFIAGRSLQGFGEGLLTVAIFYGLVEFNGQPKQRAVGLASVSVAWLSASAVSPLVYWLVPIDTWRLVFWLLVGTSVSSAFLVLTGRPSLARHQSLSMWPDRGAGQVRGLLTLGTVTVIVFAFSQGATLLGNPVLVVLFGVGSLLGSAWLLLSGKLSLRITRSRAMIDALVTRGAVSSVYAVTMTFLPVVVYAQFSASPTQTAVVTALGAVGWTTGAFLQTRMTALRADVQLNLGLVGLAAGLVVIGIAVVAGGPLPLVVAGAFSAGTGTGIATNSLPAFISELSSFDRTSSDLSAAESVDTISTTVLIAGLGCLLSPSLSSSSTNEVRGMLFLGGAAMAGVVGIYVTRRFGAVRSGART